MIQEELPVQAAGHALVAEGDEGIAAQLFQGQALTCQRGEGPATHQHLVKRLQLHHFQPRLDLRRGAHNGKIHLAILHGLHRLRGGVVRDAQPDAGIFGMEIPQLFGKINVERRLGGADADGSVLQRGTGAQLLLGILDLHRRRSNAGVEHLAFRCQGHTPVGADEQHAVQLAFQPVHRVGDVGLVVAQHPRGLGKVLILRHIIENLVILPIYIHDTSAPSM